MKVELELDETQVAYWATAHTRHLSGTATPGQQLREQVIKACRKHYGDKVPAITWWRVSHHDDDGQQCEQIVPSYIEAAELVRELLHEGIQDVEIRRHFRQNR